MYKVFLNVIKITFILFTYCIAFTVSAQSLKPELNKALTNASQGTIVELPGVLNKNIQSIDYNKIILPGPQHLISDDPEYIRVPEAIALREPVKPGLVRLYVYNVNGVKEPQKMDRKITAVIQNSGQDVMNLRMQKYSSQPPSGNYFQIGKEGLADFFASEPEKEIRTVEPGEAIAIDPKLEKLAVQYNDLVHGFYEFTIDQPGVISVLQTSPDKSGPEALKEIDNVLPPKSHSGAGRGTFGVSNYQVNTKDVYNTEDGISQLIVADGEKDPWVKGFESTTGQQAELAGNYGVMYEIEVDWKSTDGKGLALVTWNSRSADSKWCGGMAASMVVSQGKFDGGIVRLPSDQLITRKAPEAILIQVFPPASKDVVQTIKLTYSPPGASCLPTPLVLIPVDMK